MSRFTGKVALVTGAARGQGRAHAEAFAREGADVIAIDICGEVESAFYPLATPEDLAETAREVEKHDRRIVTRQADVRDTEALRAAVSEGVAELGRLDVVVANAGITGFSPALELSDQQWEDMIGINLTGVFKTLRATLPIIVEQGEGGAAVVTSSSMGIKGGAYLAHYASAKHGLNGLVKSLALELGSHGVRVNTVHPTGVDTPMLQNETTRRLFVPGDDDPSQDQFAAAAATTHPLGIPWVHPEDISRAVLWLASDDARYVTGVALPVDAGFTIK